MVASLAPATIDITRESGGTGSLQIFKDAREALGLYAENDYRIREPANFRRGVGVRLEHLDAVLCDELPAASFTRVTAENSIGWNQILAK
jgi:hypothetical protein